MIQGFAELAKTVPDAVLLCMGNTPKEEQAYFDKLEALQKSLPPVATASVRFYHPDVSTVLSAADVLLMDSFFEGWSLAATEALLTGTPLIHSLCGSAEELCGANSERGFVIPNPGGDIMKLELGPLWRLPTDPINPTSQRFIPRWRKPYKNGMSGAVNGPQSAPMLDGCFIRRPSHALRPDLLFLYQKLRPGTHHACPFSDWDTTGSDQAGAALSCAAA